MSSYYCRSCAIALGHIDRSLLPAVNLTGDASGYQMGKYLKHAVTGYYSSGTVSLFGNPDYENYRSYVVGATISGCVEIDDSRTPDIAPRDFLIFPGVFRIPRCEGVRTQTCPLFLASGGWAPPCPTVEHETDSLTLGTDNTSDSSTIEGGCKLQALTASPSRLGSTLAGPSDLGAALGWLERG